MCLAKNDIHPSATQRIDDFFSKDVTHVITDQPIRPSDAAKENRPSSRGSTSKLKSPLQLKSKCVFIVTRP